MSTECVFDMKRIQELKELDDDDQFETLKFLSQSYIKNTGPKLVELRQFYECSNSIEMKKTAHFIRSSSLNLGISSLATLISEIEYGDGMADNDLKSKIDSAEDLFDKVKAKLKELNLV